MGFFGFFFIVPLGLKGVGFLYMCNKVVIRMFLINKFYQMDVILCHNSQHAISLYDVTVFNMYHLYVYTVFF